MSNWLEDLPKKCPPKKATPQEGTYFRLIDSSELRIDDFFSNRKLFPKKVFHNINECTVRSCSIFDDLDHCSRQKKYPRLKNKKILKINLNEKMGVLSKTFGPNHYSWWVTNSILTHSHQFEVINDQA